MTAPKPAKKPGLPCDGLNSEEAAFALELAATLQDPSKTPGPHQLRTISLFLLLRPDRISDPAMAPHILKVLREFVADNPPRSPSSKTIALMVDWWVNGGDGMDVTYARRRVAEATGKSLDAVKKAHIRFGSKYEA